MEVKEKMLITVAKVSFVKKLFLNGTHKSRFYYVVILPQSALEKLCKSLLLFLFFKKNMK